MDQAELLMLPMAKAAKHPTGHHQYAFNGDTFLPEKVLILKEKHGIARVYEAGSHIGTTTIWFAKNFSEVVTSEIDPDHLLIARHRWYGEDSGGLAPIVSSSMSSDPSAKIISFNGSGVSMIQHMRFDIGEKCLFFLDARPMTSTDAGYNVLVQELAALAEVGTKPQVLVIHNMQNPNNPEFQFVLGWIKPHLDAIYGDGGYIHWHNKEASAAGTGILFVERPT